MIGPVITGGFSGTTWGTWRRRAISICTAAAAALAVLVKIHESYPVLEPWMWTSHAYARDLMLEIEKKTETVAKQNADALADALKKREDADNQQKAKVERVLHHIQLEQAQGKSEATDNDLFKAGLELKKATDDQTRQYIQEQVNKLNATKHRLDSQIETLSKGQGD